MTPRTKSVESEKNRFTIIPKGKNTAAIDLELDPFMQHGHVIELTGKTEAGARVMVNGREVPVIGMDGSFHYFMPPLPTGRERDHDYGAECQGRSEYGTEKDRDSVGQHRPGRIPEVLELWFDGKTGFIP